MKTILFILAFASSLAFAQIQRSGIKTVAYCTAHGATVPGCLTGTDQVWDLHNNQQLSVSIATGALTGGGSSLPFGLSNLGLAASVASNAITVSMKIPDGSTNPSSGTPVSVSFRSPTITNGGFVTINQQSAVSIVVPSGATLGQSSGAASTTYIYAQDNSGSLQMCASSSNSWSESVLQTTTAISSGATSSGLLYCTAAVTGPVRFLGKFISTQTTAGAWAAAPSAISLAGIVTQAPIRAHYIGNISITNCGSIFQVNGGAAWTSYPVQTGCTWTSDNGSLSAPATQIPAFMLNVTAAGTYQIFANGAFDEQGTAAGNINSFWDGSQRSVSHPNTSAYLMPFFSGELQYTSAVGSKQIEIQGWSGNGFSLYIYATAPATLTFSVYFLPSK